MARAWLAGRLRCLGRVVVGLGPGPGAGAEAGVELRSRPGERTLAGAKAVSCLKRGDGSRGTVM